MSRRKIGMKMLRNTNSKQVAFSKHRHGLFKKANELATLCAAQVAVIVFTPGGKPFSFGHPSVDSVSQRFLNQYFDKPNQHVVDHLDDEPKLQEAGGGGVEDLNQQLNDLLQQIDIEKKRGEMLDKAIKKEAETCKYIKPLKKMDQNEILDMKTSLEKLRHKLKGRASEMEASSSLLLLNDAPKDVDN